MSDRGVTWRSHPLVDDFPRSALVLAAIAAASVAAAMAFDGAGYGAIAAALLAASLARYLLPTRYELRPDGIAIRFLGTTRLVGWHDVKRVEMCRDGVFLSPLPRRSRLDSFRGTFLRFNGNRDEVVNFVREKLGPAAQAEGGPAPRLRP